MSFYELLRFGKFDSNGTKKDCVVGWINPETRAKESFSALSCGVTMNPDIWPAPSSALVSKPSTRGVNKCLTIMSEFFLGAD